MGDITKSKNAYRAGLKATVVLFVLAIIFTIFGLIEETGSIAQFSQAKTVDVPWHLYWCHQFNKNLWMPGMLVAALQAVATMVMYRASRRQRIVPWVIGYVAASILCALVLLGSVIWLCFHGAFSIGPGISIIYRWDGLLAPVVFTVILLSPWVFVYFGWRYGQGLPNRPCPQCSYDLTGNTTGTCPECGHVIEKNSAESD